MSLGWLPERETVVEHAWLQADCVREKLCANRVHRLMVLTVPVGGLSVCRWTRGLGARQAEQQVSWVAYCDEKVANREIRVWHREWLLNDGQIQNPSVQS
jgi:hypothetical protein